VPIGKINSQLLEEFYAQLRQRRIRRNGGVPIDHRVDGPHEFRVASTGRLLAARLSTDTEPTMGQAGCVAMVALP
jgi:hypothetical protein